MKPQLTAYKYDQLNRIKQMKAYSMVVNAGNVSISTDDSYKTNMDYDANGNITHMTRNGSPQTLANGDHVPLAMDDLSYQYETKANSYTRNTNKLRYVNDAVAKTHTFNSQQVESYATDIDDQSKDNYTYDEIGNLKSDVQEEIANIEWTVYGKVKSVTRTSGSTKSDLEFHYDASGNRISKIVKPHATASNASTWTTTYYVRDASGNVMSTYETKPNDTKFYLAEQYLYGSSRLGLLSRDLDMSTTPGALTWRTLGKKNYEMTNHLGNVLTTITDRKIPHNNSGTIDYYTADITNASDYGVWGDILPQRGKAFDNKYKYGFNGKEKTDEWNGVTGGNYDYGERIYDSRLGRFLSIDPITKDFPYLTPYQYSSNDPIGNIDIDGLEGLRPGIRAPRPWISLENYNAIYEQRFRVRRIYSPTNLPSGSPTEYRILEPKETTRGKIVNILLEGLDNAMEFKAEINFDFKLVEETRNAGSKDSKPSFQLKFNDSRAQKLFEDKQAAYEKKYAIKLKEVAGDAPDIRKYDLKTPEGARKYEMDMAGYGLMKSVVKEELGKSPFEKVVELIKKNADNKGSQDVQVEQIIENESTIRPTPPVTAE